MLRSCDVCRNSVAERFAGPLHGFLHRSCTAWAARIYRPGACTRGPNVLDLLRAKRDYHVLDNLRRPSARLRVSRNGHRTPPPAAAPRSPQAPPSGPGQRESAISRWRASWSPCSANLICVARSYSFTFVILLDRRLRFPPLPRASNSGGGGRPAFARCPSRSPHSGGMIVAE